MIKFPEGTRTSGTNCEDWTENNNHMKTPKMHGKLALRIIIPYCDISVNPFLLNKNM